MSEKVKSKKVDFRDSLLGISKAAVEKSEGRMRLAFNEEDTTTEKQPEASYFLKLDESRLGRDIYTYGFIGEASNSNIMACAMYLEEVLLPLKSAIPEAYKTAGEGLKTLGLKNIDESDSETRNAWIDLF